MMTREEAMIKAAKIGAIGAILGAVLGASLSAIILVVGPRLLTPQTVSTNSLAPYGGSLLLDDPMKDNSYGHNWEEDSTCQFSDGAYHAKVSEAYHFAPCLVKGINVSNFAFQVIMAIVQGNKGGILFRCNMQINACYYAHIWINGVYEWGIFNGKLFKRGSNSAIRAGLNQYNLITIVANGANMDLYINQQHIDSANDATYNQGQIGVFAKDEVDPTEVVFSDAKVWIL